MGLDTRNSDVSALSCPNTATWPVLDPTPKSIESLLAFTCCEHSHHCVYKADRTLYPASKPPNNQTSLPPNSMNLCAYTSPSLLMFKRFYPSPHHHSHPAHVTHSETERHARESASMRDCRCRDVESGSGLCVGLRAVFRMVVVAGCEEDR
jgi:hypothetical protein